MILVLHSVFLQRLFDTIGNPQTSYNSSGILIYNFNPTLRQNGIVAKPYMNQMILGLQPGNEGNFVVQTIDSIGAFGTAQYFDVYGNHDEIEDMLLTDLGELYFCGQSRLPGSYNPGYTSDYFTGFRFKINQLTIDSSFTDSVFFLESFNGYDESGAHCLAESPDGIVFGGYVNNINASNLSDIGILRIFKDDSSVVSTQHVFNKTSVKVYPNPTRSTVMAEGFPLNSQYNIYDLTGKLVISGSLITSSIIDLSGLPPSQYVLRLRTGEETSIHHVVLIE